MKRYPLRLSILVICLVFCVAATAAAREKVIIFHAGSLSVPFAKIEKTFEAREFDTHILYANQEVNPFPAGQTGAAV